MTDWINIKNLRQGISALIRAKKLIRMSIDMPFSNEKSVWQEYWKTPGVEDFNQLCMLLNEAENFARKSIRRLKNAK